ncbi:MAG: N-succinylarginine dihydrolase [Deltaproteobacteria bacterium]|nr:MAG: N-succinylarginine dihydrolase [Deltaproteobacteria bacterium]
MAREYNFDGLVGPTHNYAGLSFGNVASQEHAGQPADPRAAALQGLAKMRFVASLAVGQAVLPPHERPSLRTLRRLGFRGSDEEVIARAAADPELRDHLLRISSSAAAMWTANAATCVPGTDAEDGRLHLMPANLTAMFHRSLEAETTARVLRAIFADPRRFEVHDPLPGGTHFADEGAANHTRLLVPGRPAVHLFAWGRVAFGEQPRAGESQRYPARQTREASHALARLGQVDPARALFPQQHPEGIDAGAFHTDVVAVGNGHLLLLHEKAFAETDALLKKLRELLSDQFIAKVATEAQLPLASAVAAYPFNSQLLTLPDGSMTIVAPVESREDPRARSFLESAPVASVHYLDLRESMQNGGGPACLRQRIVLSDEERAAVGARVFWDEELGAELERWVQRHYRDRLTGKDLADVRLWRETLAALDELTRILRLGSVYDFQR